MYRQGWDERNGGNISLRLNEDEVAEYLDTEKVIREIPTGFSQPGAGGNVFPGHRHRKVFQECTL